MEILNSPWFVLAVSSVVLLLVWVAKHYGINLPISVNPEGLPPIQAEMLAILKAMLARQQDQIDQHSAENRALFQQLAGPQVQAQAPAITGLPQYTAVMNVPYEIRLVPLEQKT